jgi:hypothetical protein
METRKLVGSVHHIACNGLFWCPYGRDDIITKDAIAKTGFTIHEVVLGAIAELVNTKENGLASKGESTYNPSPPEGFNLIFRRVSILGYETSFNSLPVVQEFDPPALKRLDVVRPYALDSFYLKCSS